MLIRHIADQTFILIGMFFGKLENLFNPGCIYQISCFLLKADALSHHNHFTFFIIQ